MTPVLRGLDIGLYAGIREPVLAPTGPIALDADGTVWLQYLRDGDSILGPITFYRMTLDSDKDVNEMYQAAFLRAEEPQSVLIDLEANKRAHLTWVATPGEEIITPEDGALRFRCSSRDVTAAVFFYKT